MAALLLARPRLFQVACGTFKLDVPFQSYSSKIEDDLRTVKPTDPGVKPYSAVPEVPHLPIIGTIPWYATGEYDLKRSYKLYSSFLKDFGPLVKEHAYYGRIVVHVFAPEDIKEVYRTEALAHPMRISHRALGKYREARKHLYDVPGVSVSNGREWAEYRGLFRQLVRKSTLAAFEEIADDLIQYIKSNLDHNGEIPLLPTLYYYTLECIGALVLGKRFGCFDKDRRDSVSRFIKAAHDTHYAIRETETGHPYLTKKHYKVLESAQDLMAGYVIKHMRYLTDLMETARLRNAEAGSEQEIALIDGESGNSPIRPSESFIYQYLKKGMSHSKLLPMAVDLFIGGIHTTAHSLTFALYNLALNPEVQVILREELLREFPNKTDRVSGLDKIKNLEYLSKVLRETLRLNPAALGTGRVLQQDVVLSGFCVPKGTVVILHHEVASKEESNFPQPFEFNPMRDRESFKSLACRPFTIGKRICMGVNIATQEMKMGLVKIMREFELSYHHKRVGVVNYLINEPDGVIMLRFKESPVGKEDRKDDLKTI